MVKHSIDYLAEFICVMVRSSNSLKRVAMRANLNGHFLFIRSGEARHPFRVRELGRQIAGLAQFEICCGRFSRGYVYGRSPVQIKTVGPYAQIVVARIKPSRGE